MNAKSIAPGAQTYGRLISFLVWMRNDSDRALAELKLNTPEFVALRLCVKSKYTVDMTYLAEFLHCTKGYASKIVARLKKRGLVDVKRHKVYNPAARRYVGRGKAVSLTRSGFILYVRAFHAIDWRRAIALLNPQQIAVLDDALMALRFSCSDASYQNARGDYGVVVDDP